MNKPKDKHYRTISPQFARKNFVQITAGYVAAHKVEGATAVIDGDPAEMEFKKIVVEQCAENLIGLVEQRINELENNE